MAKVTFTDNLNIKPQRQNFPRLKGLKKDEKVRIQLIDPTEIEMKFVHNLEAPVIDNGEAVRLENGDIKMKYMGSPLSFGDESILDATGADVKNCPISKFAKEHPDWVDAPKRKFAMNIVKYRTKPGSFELASPYSVEHMIWVFTDKTFLKLQELAAAWEDLKRHDLYITCTNEKFQQYDIQVSPKAAWLEDAKTTKANFKHTMEVYKAGKEEYNDLSGAIGSVKERSWVEKDLQEIENSWNIVLGRNSSTPSLSSDTDLDSLLGGITDEEAPAQETRTESVSTESSAEDFDSILADLGLE